MAKVQNYHEVDVPDGFAEWDDAARLNYLQSAMSRAQLANYVRELYGIESRDKPLFRKDELAQIAVSHEG